ncbi:hypothetical protein CSV79_01595 [Sporosarcina sp. P13]|uniref:hypothetical protein n=1 Tax=Sporosarcina sp. P13 TaxID=2048263 RepID=UPI000C163F58|nr:hypothetical protein [Sporosarcina sp. P13]PIC65342.1 hypothetical protein CSV79_01595 [Sporosarcina sp. P13]
MFKLLRLNLQFFSADPAGEGATPPVDPAGTPPGGSGQPAPPTPPVETPPTEPKSFSQDDVNNLIARETKKQQEKMLKDLGIEDFKGAKEGLAKLKEFQDAQKTESERQAEALKEFETKNGTLSSENETLKAQLSAMKAGVIAESIEDVVVLAKTMVNDETDMNAAIAKVVEKYPQFAKAAEQEPDPNTPPKPQFSNGQHQQQPQSETDKWLAAFK